MSVVTTLGRVVYTLPRIAEAGDPPCTDQWGATSTTNAPDARTFHTAVWTGTEMIIWGGADPAQNFNTGGRYNPSTDSWRATSTTNAPSARSFHTAVWTGNEMIVWGGGDVLNTGGRYNPTTNSWRATSTANAPTGREPHTAVWTGSEMIVWGGLGCNPDCLPLNTGGRYNPSTNSWTATSLTNAPTARWNQTAIWTGSEMIVWGGTSNGNPGLDTGGRYDPGHEYVDSHKLHQRAHCPNLSHGNLDRQRNDRLGRRGRRSCLPHATEHRPQI